ncbi:hypothetical protein NPX13_g5095 [Xylaria arbuscula]|uniref:Uncharacterized protein n=1 Tax=Xylaria arbuscula TaxID=114810 RepID=A0A9W8NF69_9PEZI|nr:hypothetical protein NPX13_g5095 [Xylaria arbuscula]
MNVGIVAGYDGSAAETFTQYGVDIWDAGEGWKGFTGEEANAVYGFEDWVDVAMLSGAIAVLLNFNRKKESPEANKWRHILVRFNSTLYQKFQVVESQPDSNMHKIF